MKDFLGRRGFIKYLFALGAFGMTSLFSIKKDEGFRIGKRKKFTVDIPEASATCGAGLGCAGGGGMCGAGLGCAGGGGMCGAGLGCAGGQGDPNPYDRDGDRNPYGGGGGMCGAGLGCAGGGGMCGAGLGCAGGGGMCGAGLGCAGN